MSATSELAKQLFEGLKAGKEALHVLAPGLDNFGTEVKAELSRLGTQGSMELASMLFNGSGFVPYGPGQYTPDISPSQAGHDQEHGQQHEHGHEHEMSRER